MSQRILRRSVLATLLLFTGGISAQADEIFTVRIENVSAKDALKLSTARRNRWEWRLSSTSFTRTARRYSRPASQIAAKDSRP
jgi:hypothetical protein